MKLTYGQPMPGVCSDSTSRTVISLSPYAVAICVRPSTTTWVSVASTTATALVQRDAERLGDVEPDGRAGLLGRGAHDDAALLCRGDRDHAAEGDDPDPLAFEVADEVLQRRLRRGVLQRVFHGRDLLSLRL